MARTKSKVEEPNPTAYHQLGDQESMASYEASKEGSAGVYRIDYKQSDSVFALVSPAWLSVQEHFIKIGDKIHRLVCPVHATQDEQKIMNTWGYSEGCPFCRFKQEIYESTDKDDADPVTKARRSIAKDISSNLITYLFAIKGQVVLEKVRGKRIPTPDFTDAIAKKLSLSKDAFEKFYTAFKESGLNSKDVIGLPVNFIIGKSDKATFSSVQRVEFYPSNNATKLINPFPEPPDNMFGNLDVPDMQAIDSIFEEFENAYEEMVVGKVSGSKKRASSRKGKGKK